MGRDRAAQKKAGKLNKEGAGVEKIICKKKKYWRSVRLMPRLEKLADAPSYREGTPDICSDKGGKRKQKGLGERIRENQELTIGKGTHQGSNRDRILLSRKTKGAEGPRLQTNRQVGGE